MNPRPPRPPPERDFCPLCPDVLVLPIPDPTPRPTRLRNALLPGLFTRSLSVTRGATSLNNRAGGVGATARKKRRHIIAIPTKSSFVRWDFPLGKDLTKSLWRAGEQQQRRNIHTQCSRSSGLRLEAGWALEARSNPAAANPVVLPPTAHPRDRVVPRMRRNPTLVASCSAVGTSRTCP